MNKFKQTEIGLIPEDWEVNRFGDYVSLKNGINFSKEEKGKEGIPTIDVKNMFTNSYQVSLNNLYRVNKKVSEDFILQKNDLLFVRSSLVREGVGYTTLFVESIENISFCGFIIRARLCSDKTFFPIYLTYFFRSDFARNLLVAGSGKLAITNINQDVLKKMLIPTPKLTEQRKIAYILTTIQRAIEKQEEIIKTTTELKKALMKKLFTEGLNGEKQKETEIGLVPESWEVKSINNLYNIQQGKQVSKKNRIGTNQKFFLRTKNILWGKVLLNELDKMNFTSDEESKFELNIGDLLVCEGGDVGRTAIIKEKIEGCYYQNHLHRLRVIDKNYINSEFTLYWLMYAFPNNIYSGHHNVTTIPNLSKSRLGSFIHPLPKVDEQKGIIRVLKKLDSKIISNSIIKKKIEQLFNSTLNQLMTGQKRVNEIDFPNMQ